MKRLLAVLVVGAMILFACGAPEADPIPFSWNHPFVNELTVANIDEAAELLRFPPIVPEGLGKPVRIVVDERPTRLGKKIALIYDHPNHGRFHVIETTSSMTQADLESLAENCDPGSGCTAQMDTVSLAPGLVGVQIKGMVANSVIWKVGHIRFDVIGPAETLDPGGSLDIARAFVAASSFA
jgi:hypothetical protein